MSNVLNFEERVKGYKFEKEVINVLTDNSSLYEFNRDNNQGIAFLHYNKYVYIFFKYIPRGTPTDLPNLKDSFLGVEKKQRYSNGEWVVNGISMLSKKNALKLFPFIYAKNKKSGWITTIRNYVLNDTPLNNS